MALAIILTTMERSGKDIITFSKDGRHQNIGQARSERLMKLKEIAMSAGMLTTCC